MELPDRKLQSRLNQLFAQTDILCFLRLFALFLFHFPQAVLHGLAAFAKFTDPVPRGLDVCVIRFGGLDPLDATGGLFSTSICWKRKA